MIGLKVTAKWVDLAEWWEHFLLSLLYKIEVELNLWGLYKWWT